MLPYAVYAIVSTPSAQLTRKMCAAYSAVVSPKGAVSVKLQQKICPSTELRRFHIPPDLREAEDCYTTLQAEETVNCIVADADGSPLQPHFLSRDSRHAHKRATFRARDFILCYYDGQLHIERYFISSVTDADAVSVGRLHLPEGQSSLSIRRRLIAALKERNSCQANDCLPHFANL